MSTPTTLQDGIQSAGSPMGLLWKPDQPPWKPPVVEDEYAGWREEQKAWDERVAISDLSYHMRDLFIEGPDATKLLADTSANNYEKFEINQAKQFVPVTERGFIVQDGILMRDADDRYVLTGPAASQSWVLYHAERGDYDVSFFDEPSSEYRYDGKPPRLFRFQVQGPDAMAVVEKVFGGPLPPTKFFHAAPATLEGRSFRALRHGMAGQPGYEFIGNYDDHDFVRETFLKAGEEFGIVPIGALAYSINNLEGGWIPTPTPAIYTDDALRDYREWLPFFSFEGQNGLHGSYFSDNIEDYYISPYELGYGRSISFNHDFIGRDALKALESDVRRTKVTLELNVEQAKAVFGDGYFLTHARDRVETADGNLVGVTFHTGPVDPLGVVLALALLDNAHAEPGTELRVIRGEHPGPGAGADADFEKHALDAVVRPAPYGDFARTQYRADQQ